jgi:hypothetical protein
MQLSTDRRLLGLVTALALAAGCDNKPKGTVGGSNAADTTAAPATASGQTARQFAEAFLKDLGDGKSKSDQMTRSFRIKIPGDGKPESNELDYLLQFKGATFVIPEEAKLGSAVTFHGRAKLTDKSASISLRVVPAANGYQVDWLHISDRQGSEVKTPADAELAAAQDIARNFLDLMLGGDLRLDRGLMTLEWKKKLAPAPPAEAKKGVEYDTGFLTQTMRAWKRDFLGYTLSTGDLDSNHATATFVATMDAGSSKTPFVIKLIKDKATGEWLVNDFDAQK